jgi:mono/diheme cytochrome c family protein
MKTSPIFSLRYLLLALLIIVTVAAVRHVSARKAQTAPAPAPVASQPSVQFSADDVSILFPVPTRKEDFAKIIAVSELKDAQGASVWPDAIFQRFLEIVASDQAQVDVTARIGLPKEAQSIRAWFIAGIRIDAGAPGLSSAIHEQFGQLPEIRLIVQPVTRGPLGEPVVQDIAGHLIYNFTSDPPKPAAQNGCLPLFVPDMATFHSIVVDLATLRDELRDGALGAHKVSTAGVPLGVHPGLADPATADQFRTELIRILAKYVSGARLGSMAIAGLPAGKPAPWIFLSMLGVPPHTSPALPQGGFLAVNGPTLDGQQFAQMLQPAGKNPRVLPAPHTNNLNPITCQNAAVPANPPIASRNGVATAMLFDGPKLPDDKTKDLLDTIADPIKSHFFNTDCISCHTETRRAMDLVKVTSVPGVDPAVLPNGPWDVRNFGWGEAGKAGMQATVTRRTANETAAVVNFINSQMLDKQAVPHP